MADKPYTDADVALVARALAANRGDQCFDFDGPQWDGTKEVHRMDARDVLDALAAADRLKPTTTDAQVRAGADALVRLRTQAPSLSELADDEQECWLADARAVLEAAGPLAPVDDDPRHIIEFRPDGWTIKHPLSCRIGDLFGCRVNLAAEDLGRPPYLGRYEVTVDGIDGQLRVGDRVDPVEG